MRRSPYPWEVKEKESEVQSRAAAVAAWEALFRAQVSVMRSLAASFPTDEISLNEYDVLPAVVTLAGDAVDVGSRASAVATIIPKAPIINKRKSR